MEQSIKTNRLAVVSFVCGLLAIGFWISGPVLDRAGLTYYLIIPLAFLTMVSPITGALALIQIKKKNGAEKGKVLAWIGIVFPLGWPLFQLVLLFIIFPHGF